MKPILTLLVLLFFEMPLSTAWSQNWMVTPQATQAPPQATATAGPTQSVPQVISNTPVAIVPAANPEESITDYWYLGLGSGLSLPVENWPPAYMVGLDDSLFVGHAFDRNFSIQFEVEQASYSGLSTSFYDPRILGEVKWTFEGELLRTYFIGGGGFDLEYYSTGLPIAVNLDMAAGMGLQYNLGDRKYLFIEGRFNWVLTPIYPLQDIPVKVGIFMGL